jgi:TetR/AcrR family transcriptional regulator, transcriptional repressor of aconitase
MGFKTGIRHLERFDNRCANCHNVFMPATMTDEEAAARRARILTAARWCFLNFGFAKTAFEDIARRAGLSRTLLYRIFKDKEDIYRAVFVDWLVSRHPAAKEAANGPGSAYERLLSVCRLMALEPWAEMVGAPMGSEFLEACERIDPESEALYRKVALECVAAILGDEASAEVFLLALDGLLADQPSMEVLEQRTQLLAARFAPRSSKKGARS